MVQSLVLLLCAGSLLLSSCTKSVTLHHQPVTTTLLVETVRSVHAIEASSVALSQALVLGHQAACGALAPAEKVSNPLCSKATVVLKWYLINYASPLAVALTAAKHELQLAASLPSSTTGEKITTALALLQQLWREIDGWGKAQGWGG